jgi:hypothetical protein
MFKSVGFASVVVVSLVSLVGCAVEDASSIEPRGASASTERKKDVAPDAEREADPVDDEAAGNVPSLANNGGVDKGAGIAECFIEGGAGLDLLREERTKASCAAACGTIGVDHPNATCLWGDIDIGSTGACHLVGGAGAEILSDKRSRGACFSVCRVTAVDRPNLSCKWNETDITMTGTCQVTGGAGLAIVSDSRSRGACLNACNENLAAHPNEVCFWNGISLR